MKTICFLTTSRLAALGLGLILILGAGCAVLRTETTAAQPSLYVLDTASDTLYSKPAAQDAWPGTAPSLLVGSPRAAAGFDSKRIIYLRMAHQLEYFSSAEWVDVPARMLAPMIVSSLEKRGAFRAVVQSPGSASADLRLDTAVVVLQHEFVETPSRVRFVLRVSLIDERSRLVVATREFESVAKAQSDDPYAGVVAANRAVAAVLEQLSVFCADGAQRWRRGQASLR